MQDSKENGIPGLLERLSSSRFRCGFHLTESDRSMIRIRGLDTVHRHARDFVSRRLAPAFPYRDGRQTPFRGHPVFRAQHATATCCRNCLQKWHRLEKGRELTEPEKEYVVAVLMAWLQRELG